jgi:hypothetical protein
MSEKQKQEKPWGVLGQLKNHDVILLACVPKRIDDPRFPRLKGFPVSICYPGMVPPEEKSPDGQEVNPEELKHTCFFPHLETFVQVRSKRTMDYFTPWDGPDWVRVIHDGEEELWWVYQYKGPKVVRTAKGPDFRRVMYHATFGGLNFAEEMKRLREDEESE